VSATNEEMQLVCFFEDFKIRDLPDEAANAVEMTVEEISAYYEETMITCAAAAMGIEF
jgi:hypothetical protein